jgi:hypothetical protein
MPDKEFEVPDVLYVIENIDLAIWQAETDVSEFGFPAGEHLVAEYKFVGFKKASVKIEVQDAG